MLKLHAVSKHFGGVKAVNQVTLEVTDDVVHGLIGPNGAGKTTLLNLVSGLLSHSSGRIELAGQSIGDLAAHERARIGIARTFQNLRIYPNLTVEQNIAVAQFSSRSSQVTHQELVAAAISRFDLVDKRQWLASALSYGHLRRLEIVRALALAPRILMLDEPAAGMNHQETEDLIDGLKWIRTHHPCAILVIDHDLRFIMSVCDHITVLTMGAVLASGTPQEISTDPQVIAAYLGEGAHHQLQ